MKSSEGLLILATVVILYWGGFWYYGVEVGATNAESIIGIIFGFLIPIFTMKYVNDKCGWDWS